MARGYMKIHKVAVILFVSFVFCIFFGLAASAFCNDTDGGLNYFQYGEVFYSGNSSNITLVDSCFNNLLLERYCANETGYTKSYECANGCLSGACIQIQQNETQNNTLSTVCDELSSEVKAGVKKLLDSREKVVLREGEAIRVGGYVVLGNAETGGNLLQVIRVYNASQGYQNDYVEFRDEIYNASYKIAVLAEGIGILDVGGKIFDVRYSAGLGSLPEMRTVWITWAPIEILTDYTSCFFDEQAACTDSDGGLNYFVKGNILVRGSNFVFTDYCLTYSPNSLLEYYCSESQGSARSFACPAGCFDGRCTNENETCAAGWYCYNSYSRAYLNASCYWSSFERCSPGSRCENGECIETVNNQREQCSDSDGGINYYKQGTISIGGKPYAKDVCRNSNSVVEWYCRTDDKSHYASSMYTCEGSCVEGACLQPSGIQAYAVNTNGEDGHFLEGLGKFFRKLFG